MQIAESLEHALREILKSAGIGGLESLLQRGRVPSAENTPPVDPRTQELREVLKAIGANADSFRALKEFLASPENIKAPFSELLGRMDAKNVLAEGSKQTLVLSEHVLQSVNRIKDLLSNASAQNLKVLIESLQRNGLLSQPDTAPITSHESLSSLESKLADILESRQGENPRMGRIEKPLQRLVEILSALPKTSEALILQGEKLLETVLRGHLMSFREIEHEVAVAIEPAFADNPLKTLLSTAERAAKVISNPSTEIEQSYLRFVVGLQQDLNKYAEYFPEAFRSVKEILEKALQTIEKEFKLQLSMPIYEKLNAEPESLPRKALVLLRSLEAQMTTLLSMPDQDLNHLIEALRNDFSPSRPEVLRNIESLFRELRSIEVPGTKSEKELFQKQIESLQLNFMRALQTKTEPQSLRATLNELLQTLKDFSSWPSAQDEHSLSQLGTKSEARVPVSQITKEVVPGILRHLEGQIKETIKLIDGFSSGLSELTSKESTAQTAAQRTPDKIAENVLQERLSREFGKYKEQDLLQQLLPTQQFDHQEQRIALLKDPSVAILLKVLKNIEWPTSAAGSTTEKHFLDFLKELSQKFSSKDAKSEKETLSRKEIEDGLTKLEQQFRAEQTRPVDPKELQFKNMLNLIEQTMKGQELLERLNTVMNILGEPALFLFPSIINGLASQFEFVGYPASPTDEAEHEEKSGLKKDKKGAYKRFEFDMSFSGIGRIQSKVFFRDGEFLLDLCAENNSVADFLEQRLSRFETLLHSQGYEKTELRVSVAPFSNLSPAWVPALLSAFDGAAKV